MATIDGSINGPRASAQIRRALHPSAPGQRSYRRWRRDLAPVPADAGAVAGTS
jgi:hypothetical protein